MTTAIRAGVLVMAVLCVGPSVSEAACCRQACARTVPEDPVAEAAARKKTERMLSIALVAALGGMAVGPVAGFARELWRLANRADEPRRPWDNL